MATSLLHLPRTRWFDFWMISQVIAVAAVLLLLAGLLLAPEQSLRVLWYAVVPILPATFFVNTTLWRSVCPLATLNAWGNHLVRPRHSTPRVTAVLSVDGLLLFHLMVPARRFLFNVDGPALAITILAVGGLALALGGLSVVRSAFCNALCPVLPVERLYGQAPLVPMMRGRCTTCTTCTTCTPRGCLDLAGGRALVQVIGRKHRTTAWLRTPHGLFIAGLPGFIFGYGMLTDGTLANATLTYATTLGWSLASVVIVAMLALGTRLDATRLFPLLGGVSGLLYYWCAGPAIAEAFGAGAGLSVGIRLLGMGLATLWLWRAWRSSPPAPLSPALATPS